jgi:hypothetical protein
MVTDESRSAMTATGFLNEIEHKRISLVEKLVVLDQCKDDEYDTAVFEVLLACLRLGRANRRARVTLPAMTKVSHRAPNSEPDMLMTTPSDV